MNNKYKVNNIFNENGKSLNELINAFFLSFLDEELNFFAFSDIISSDNVLNL